MEAELKSKPGDGGDNLNEPVGSLSKRTLGASDDKGNPPKSKPRATVPLEKPTAPLRMRGRRFVGLSLPRKRCWARDHSQALRILR